MHDVHEKDTRVNVLLVEDNSVNREVATSMLNAMQCRVHEVSNGQEAVEIIRANGYGTDDR